MKKHIAVVIPAFNEEKRIRAVVADVEKYVDTIVVIDDGSHDGTAQAVKSRKAVVLQHKFNLGQGAALQTGFDYCKLINADIVITLDADGQFKASEIPQVIRPIIQNHVDVVLGSRFLGRTVDIPLSRFITLKLGLLFTNIFYGMQLTDTYNGFRSLSKKALNTITINQNRMGHPAEIIDQIKMHNLKFVEVPVTVIYNKQIFNKGLRNINSVGLLVNLITKKLFA